jgi:TetR/AcrR family transcriptional repressor of nem operon
VTTRVAFSPVFVGSAISNLTSEEFGSKQALFDAALQRYDAEVLERNFGPLEAPGAGIDEVRALLEFFGSGGEGRASGRGCLLCNTAVEFGPDDPSGAGFVQRYFEGLSEAFYAALGNAHGKGELRRSVDPREEARFFTASVLGLFVMLRAKAPPTVIESAARVAIEHLEALRTPTGT